MSACKRECERECEHERVRVRVRASVASESTGCSPCYEICTSRFTKRSPAKAVCRKGGTSK